MEGLINDLYRIHQNPHSARHIISKLVDFDAMHWVGSSK